MGDHERIKGFDSIEAAMDFMETNRMEASESAVPEQLAIANDIENPHWYMSFFGDVVIMGHVYSEAEFIELEGSYYDLEDEESREEWHWVFRNWLANRQRGIVFVRGYSVIEPDGEPGSVHVAALAPASKEAFDEFIKAKCHVTTKLLQPHVFMVIDHIRAMREAMRRK